MLRDFEDDEVLVALAGRFEQRELDRGETIVERGQPADQIVLIARSKVQRIGRGKYGDETVLGTLADGDHFIWPALLETDDYWQFTARTMTAATAMILTQQAFEEVVGQSPSLQAHIASLRERMQRASNPFGEAAIARASGHVGEPPLPQTFVDYEAKPREFELSISQTVLRVHTRVADLFNDPMDQMEQQLRLTVEALRDVYPQSVDLLGQKAPAWRGVPVLPCSKIPISEDATSAVMLMRLGKEDQGVIGLHQTGIPDEYQLRRTPWPLSFDWLQVELPRREVRGEQALPDHRSCLRR